MFTDQQFMVWTGQATLWLLIVILLARPVHKYLKFKYLMKYRRQLGWLTGIAISLHLAYWVGYYFSGKVLLSALDSLWFWAGVSGFLSIAALTATSNNWAVKKMGGARWKRLHKLTYLIPFVSLVHAHYALRGINWELMLYLIPFVLLVAWRMRDAMGHAVFFSCLLGAVYYTFSGLEIQEFSNEEDIEFVCPREHPDSVSCGWPVYLPDGTRIDSTSRSFDRHS